MDHATILKLGDELYAALRARSAVSPLSERYPDLSVAEAYRVSERMLTKRLADGERVVGQKIGITSKAVMEMLGVGQPDYGYLTDRMLLNSGAEIVLAESLIQPRAEGEVAFLLKRGLEGPGVTAVDVLRATEYVVPCFEIVDSRIQDWRIKIQDTVADNASCGLVVLGETLTDPTTVDLVTCGLVFETNGAVVATGAGAAALGSPANSVAWLANALAAYETGLEAGQLILSGSLVPLLPIQAGDNMHVRIGGMGSVSIRFR